ncbi:MAG: HNH endonuclease [Egibacteraceae bacterium]
MDAGPLPTVVPDPRSRGSARCDVRPVAQSAVSGPAQHALEGGYGEDDDAGGVGAGTTSGHCNGGPGKVLVLNATMEPLCVVPARRAVVLVLSDKADVVHANGHLFRSERLQLVAPSVVRLRRYVHVPYRRRAALSRRGVFIRDHHTCQYCGASAENVDHVVPRSRSGAHEWENVVAACRRCNTRKKDQTPAEAHMTLLRKPFAPRAAFWLIVAVGTVDPDWHAYLGDTLQAH